MGRAQSFEAQVGGFWPLKASWSSTEQHRHAPVEIAHFGGLRWAEVP